MISIWLVGNASMLVWVLKESCLVGGRHAELFKWQFLMLPTYSWRFFIYSRLQPHSLYTTCWRGALSRFSVEGDADVSANTRCPCWSRQKFLLHAFFQIVSFEWSFRNHELSILCCMSVSPNTWHRLNEAFLWILVECHLEVFDSPLLVVLADIFASRWFALSLKHCFRKITLCYARHHHDIRIILIDPTSVECPLACGFIPGILPCLNGHQKCCQWMVW